MNGAAASRRSDRVLWTVLGAAALARLAVFLLLPSADDGNDSYVQPALELLGAGRYDSFATLHRLPGMPWFIAAVYSVFGKHPAAVAFVQHGLGLATLWLLADAARRAWGDFAAATVAILLALRLQFPLQECFLLSEPLAQFFFAATLNFAVRLREREHRFALWGAAGACAAFAALTRGEFLVLGPLVACALTLPSPVHGRGAGPERVVRSALIFLSVWLFLVGGWVLRNTFVFGYTGLTPDSLTTITDTALPLIRYDSPLEAPAKIILREEAAKAATDPGLDPRPTTIERLQREHGDNYLSAETALGRVALEAASSAPGAYVRLALPNFIRYLTPSHWADTMAQLPDLQAHAAAHPAFWAVLRWDQSLDWLLLALAAAALPALFLAPAGGRWTALVLFATWASLWFLVGLLDRIVPRIQSELYLPMALLGAFTLHVLRRRTTR